ncbi:MAG: ABC transporter permease [Bacteroidetes bacterium]|nr:ABC transporter permease [Bacteroidota bacterium]
MRTIRFLLEKEFRQIFRNKSILPMIFVMPIIQLLILPLAANYEIKNISIAVVDHDHSSYSQKLISKITASGYFKLAGYNASYNQALKQVEQDKADLILEIPSGFEKNLVREDQQKVFIASNAINGIKANLGTAYLGNIIRNFNSEIRMDWIQPTRFNPMPVVEIASSNWYNPFMNYYFFMVPGILVILVTMIAGYMSALNIVKEKEIGTIEQINVTPIKKYHFILGKLIPFWVLGMVVFTIGMLVSWLIYGIIPLGNIALLYGFLAVYLLAVLGFGLLVSTYSETQQQAMSIAFFFVMIFNLMGGLYTPVDSMPEWARFISKAIPVTYFVDVMRMIVLKGSEFHNITTHLVAILIIAVVLNTWAIINYRKTSS